MTHEQAVEKQATERYLLDEMPELERFAFEEHLFACPVCAADVRAGGVLQDGVKAGLLPLVTAEGTRQNAEEGPQDLKTPRPQDSKTPDAKPQVPSPRSQVPSPAFQAPRLPTAVPWAAAAMFALAASYQALWVVPSLRHQIIGPSVLSPVTLRGATRGTEPTLTRPTTGVIALAVDLAGVAAGAGLTYDLRAAEGVSVASGTAVAPPPGTPLLLLIPASTLNADGRYTLSVGTSGAPGSASLDYRFTITERDK
jgi:hypothetical protein